MSEVVIRVENLYKEYRLGTISHGTLYRDLQSWWANLRGKEDPNSLLSSSYSEKAADNNKHFYALEDISFDVKQGEIVGIIGRNGAGKSTLLKVLSKVTAPTKGSVKIKGRVASLLEVGTGFHSELTGRENIYLNGTILGMNRKEIGAKFEEIVDFAELEEFVDTPVKRYSSGMYVRLAFAVAAYLEPEILLVDEVLAVGDAAFQKKCLGKMGEVAEGGRTVLFVSHNMAIIGNLCSRVILLKKGQLVQDNETAKTISHYLQTYSTYSDNGLSYIINRNLLKKCYHPDFQITDIALLSLSGELLKNFGTGDSLVLRIYYKAKRQFASQAFAVHIKNHFGQKVIQLNTTPISGYPITHLTHKGYVDLVFESLPLTAGRYFFDIGFIRERIEWIIKLEEIIALDIELKDVYGSGMALDNSRGVVAIPHYWVHRSVSDNLETSPIMG